MTTPALRRPFIRRGLHAFRIRPRLVASILVGLGAGLVLPSALEGQTRLLVGWDVGVALYLGLTWSLMVQADVHGLRRRAAQHDEGEWTIILLAMAATLLSLVAIGVELHQAKVADASQLWRVAGAALTILMSWLFIHTVMTQHYAHDYYLREESGIGLLFPDKVAEPDYWDFAYFAFTIGVAAQTADVAIGTPRIRRVVLAHAVLSFLFNTAILALAINVGASLL